MTLSAAFLAYLCDPPPESALRRATEFGIDLSLTFRNMYGLTPQERLEKLERHLDEAAIKPRTPPRYLGPID